MTGVDIFAIACLVFIVCYWGYIVYYAIGLYGLNPFKRGRKLGSSEVRFLEENIPQIRNLSPGEKEKLLKRTEWFASKKPFVYKGAVKNKKDVELLISASGMLLVMGMRQFKFIRSIRRIIVYPSDYYSIINRKYHVGEYNVGLRTLVFSESGLRDGFKKSDDNLHLAVHEFAHALCIETAGKNSWEAKRFQVGLRKIKDLFESSDFQDRLAQADYFRSYGNTNLIEFFAVIMENYIETPHRFQSLFPELYGLLRTMLNFEYR